MNLGVYALVKFFIASLSAVTSLMNLFGLFSHFVLCNCFSCLPLPFSCVQCQWATSTSRVRVSSSGRRGRPFFKATNWTPPVWAAGPSTSTTYSTLAAVRTEYGTEHRCFQAFPRFAFQFIFSRRVCNKFTVLYISLNVLLSWGGFRPQRASCGSHGVARRLFLPVSEVFTGRACVVSPSLTPSSSKIAHRPISGR